MLGNKRKAGGPGGTTLVSHDAVIVGDIRFSGSLDIEGMVQGNIIADDAKDARVRVVGKGRVEGEIRAPNVVINGEVRGRVYATRHLELASKCRVSGDVLYQTVEMAAGAEVNGSLKHIAEEGAPKDVVADQPGQGETRGGPKATAANAPFQARRKS
ncbi:MAG: polymer-forming cytoskeletal protein [Halioglobus sp.]|nr:polymer-forming cytoskeletal protein [Halioglobus sp.]